jgi:hypothetical protein
MPSNNILPGIVAVMAAIRQGKVDKQQREQEQKNWQADYDVRSKQLQSSIDNANRQFALDQRTAGIDPTSGQPFQLPANLQQIVSHNHGKAATPEQVAQHDLDVSNFYARNGATPLATNYREAATTGSDLATASLNRNIALAQAEFDAKTRPLQYTMMVYETMGAGQSVQAQKLQNEMDQIQIGIAKKYGVPEAQLKNALLAGQVTSQNLQNQFAQNNPLAYFAPGVVSAQIRTQYDPKMGARLTQAGARFQTTFSKATMPSVLGGGGLTPQQMQFFTPAQQQIDASTDPISAAQAILKKYPALPPYMKKMLLEYGQYAADQQQFAGGSNAAPPFPGP